MSKKANVHPSLHYSSDSSQSSSSQPLLNHTSPLRRAISISSSSSLSTVSTIPTPSALRDVSPSTPNPYTTIKPSPNLSSSQKAQLKALLLDREIERVKTLMHTPWFALSRQDKAERINRQHTDKRLLLRNGFKAPHTTWYDYFHPENEVAIERLPDRSGWRVWACERVRGHCYDDDLELRRERKLEKARRLAEIEEREEREERKKASEQLFGVEGDVDDSESESEDESDSNEEGDDSETENSEEIEDGVATEDYEDEAFEEDLEDEEEDEESDFEADESDDGSDNDYHLPGTVREGKATLRNHNRSPDRKGKAVKSRPGFLSAKGYY